MNIVFVSLGSKGNATLIEQDDTLIQIDMGVPKKAIREGLNFLNRDFKDIQAVFITHEHGDHVGTLSLYHDAYPVYCGKGTLPDTPEEHELHEGEAVDIGSIAVLPFRSSHDANNPMNFIILAGGQKFGYVTDTGFIRPHGVALLKNCDFYLMESNYGVKELAEGPYPPLLKRRIRSKHGHLSNIDSAKYASNFIGPRTKQIFLGHISDENNTPEIAEQTYRKVFRDNEVSFEKIKLIAIPQKTLQIGGDLL